MTNITAEFKEHEFINLVRRKETREFDVKVGEQVIKVVIVEYQKDPITSRLLHVDLKVAQEGLISKYMVPVKPVGTPVGLKNKGVLIQSKKRLSVRCAAENLPNSFVVDVSKLDVGDAILVREIEAPANVEILDADRIAVLGVIKAK